MDVEQFLYAMPEVAQEEIVKTGINAVSIGDGVNRLQIAGHNKGLAYYFDKIKQYNPAKSNEAGYELFDFIEICYTIVDRKNIATMPIRMVHCDASKDTFYPTPKELLAFNRDGECVGGRYRESYLNWKAGINQPGLALRKWDVLSDSMIATLEAEGIYTIEQFAEYPRERFAARFPQDFLDAHTRAQQWVNGKEMREKAAEHMGKIHELQKKLEEQEREKKDLAERLAKLEALSAGEAKNGKRKVKNKLLEN